jgi:choline dehydrogenase-like flavoprotein
LTVVADALVHRLRIADGRCSGVHYRVAGQFPTIATAGEVILCAGPSCGAEDLERAVAQAFDEAHLEMCSNDGLFDLHVSQSEMLPPLRAAELDL